MCIMDCKKDCLKYCCVCDKICEKVKGFSMKKLMKKISFAMVGIMASVPAMAAVNYNNVLCKLATEFNGIFSMLRLLAFIGAGMSIAGWAWGYIKAGKVDIQKEVSEKGVGSTRTPPAGLTVVALLENTELPVV